MAYTCQRYSGLIVAVFGHTLMREKHAVGCATLEVALLVRDTRSDGVIVLCAISGVSVLALALRGRRKLALLPTFVEVLGMLVSYAASLDFCTFDQGSHHPSPACVRADGRRLFGDQIPARSAAQPLHSARERQPKRAASSRSRQSRGLLHLFLLPDRGIGQRTPAAASLPASLLHREQQGTR